jgi:hypothetical protein
MPGQNGLFMINDPGIGNFGNLVNNQTYGESVQVRTRMFVQNGGPSNLNNRIVDFTTAGDRVPTSVSLASSTGLGFRTLFNGYDNETGLIYTFTPSVSANNLWYSSNGGASWTRGTMSASTMPVGYLQIPAFNRKYLTTRASGFTNTNTHLYTSTDGVSFTRATGAAGATFSFLIGYNALYAYSPELNIFSFMTGASSGKNIAGWTTNGDDFYLGTFSGTSFTAVAAFIYQPKFKTFLMGREGTTTANCFALSTDGKNWDPITATGNTPIGSTTQIYGLAHNPNTGRTVCCLFSGANHTQPFRYSDDGGYTWTLCSALTSAAYFMETGRYDMNTNMFIFTHRNNNTSQPGYFMSVDGVNWTRFADSTPGQIPIVTPLP